MSLFTISSSCWALFNCCLVSPLGVLKGIFKRAGKKSHLQEAVVSPSGNASARMQCSAKTPKLKCLPVDQGPEFPSELQLRV